jgi:hypothetical protein
MAKPVKANKKAKPRPKPDKKGALIPCPEKPPEVVEAPRDVLTDQDRDLIDRCFMIGPAALADYGFTAEAAREFLSRAPVAARLLLLESELRVKDAGDVRLRFMVSRALARRAPDAVRVIEAALDGNIFERDEDGTVLRNARGYPILRNAAPSDEQFEAAREVLNRLGCVPDREAFGADPTAVAALLSKAAEDAVVELVEAPDAKTPIERAQSRDRMRSLMDRLADKLEVRTNGNAVREGKNKKG